MRAALVLRAASIGLALLAGACASGSSRFEGEAPTPEEVYGSCAFCHVDLASNMTDDGGHGTLDLACESCHEDLEPGFAQCGHRAVPICRDCHTAQITHHDPGVATTRQCTICHNPHGSPNLLLVRTGLPVSNQDNMTTPCSSDADCTSIQLCASTDETCGSALRTGGCAAPITFTNLDGRADGSFASATDPGTGICEVCHTTTQFYRSDGTGEPHFGLPCYTCHEHTRGFLPD